MWRRGKTLHAKALEFFVADLGDMLAAGIDLDMALAVLAGASKLYREIALSLQAQVRRGVELGEVFRNASFSEVVVAFVRIGLVTGNLSLALAKLSSHFAERRKRREKLAKLVAYPLFLSALSTLSLYLAAWLLAPQFLRFYGAMNLSIPGSVAWLLQALEGVATGLPYALATCVIIALLLWRTRGRWLRVAERKIVQQRWGGFLRAIKAMQNFTVLALLLDAGIDLLAALQVLIVTDTARMCEEWQTMVAAIERGQPLSQALKGSPYMPELVVEMLAIAEQTGDLEGGAARLKGYYERLIVRGVERFFAAFEPVSLMVLGVLVGGITMVLMLPMTDLVKQLS